MPVQPYKGTSVNRLVALINAQLQVPLVLGTDFTFGKLGTVSAAGYNTRIRLKPVSGQYVEQDLYYTRLSLAAIGRLPVEERPPVVITQLPFTIHEVLDTINETLGLDLTPEEVFDTRFTTAQTSYRLQVRSGASVAWVPSYYDFACSIELPQNVRLLEDGSVRLMEDGTPRFLEDPVEVP